MCLNILMAEGDQQIRAVAARCLQVAGNKVHEVADGRAMLHAVMTARFDLIVTAILLPGQDARQTVARLREKLPDVRIIALESGAPGTWSQAFSEGGGVHVLPKPFTPRQLLDLVKSLFGLPADT